MHIGWELFFGLGALVLLCAIAYGAWQAKRRNPANDRVTEEATREQFDHPDTYPQRREELKDRLRPS
jgi:hypothetical protein